MNIIYINLKDLNTARIKNNNFVANEDVSYRAYRLV